MSVRRVVVLGSTGSIGVNTLDVLARHPQRFEVLALTANTQIDRLFEQCRQYMPAYAVVPDVQSAKKLAEQLHGVAASTEVLVGKEGLEHVATHARADIVVAAIVGAAGLLPALAAVRSGKRVLLANKEPLVMCGHLFLDAAQHSGAELLPVDSEHNAIFQCLPAGFRAGDSVPAIRRILLTCSGGPFRTTAASELVRVTPEQAVAHPNWVMGRKISVDSATLMNKGLELIEACWLFGVKPEKVEVVIHPQSVIHSLVEYADGSVLAQLGNPDMRTPIAHALGFPERIEAGVASLDLFTIGRLDFSPPDTERFPCLGLAQVAAERGGTAPAILNAANEVAVQSFLDRKIGFTDIPRVIEHGLACVAVHEAVTLEVVLGDDAAARAAAQSWVDAQRPVMTQRAT
ncbi:MAG: 1-deoxy-D-xylulose 5-phosphate reductoisomerase [Thiotrichales bacterium SG8_50]|nr:MAG: 1-deoxy-D-xylulose 5-phosphate reductoisomerase [Thiotrichales bacterium SG8_50]KPL28944.1 MAG: 1-deoxy-D-xylulose 5-phosphate reductoisomerase [Acidithiobacillales bacterium SM1_46]